MESESYTIEGKANGVLLVRMHSQDEAGNVLPDAVFTFRPNDPQYELWFSRFAKQNMNFQIPKGNRG